MHDHPLLAHHVRTRFARMTRRRAAVRAQHALPVAACATRLTRLLQQTDARLAATAIVSTDRRRFSDARRTMTTTFAAVLLALQQFVAHFTAATRLNVTRRRHIVAVTAVTLADDQRGARWTRTLVAWMLQYVDVPTRPLTLTRLGALGHHRSA